MTMLSLFSGEVTADEADFKAPAAKQAKCDQSIEVSFYTFIFFALLVILTAAVAV